MNGAELAQDFPVPKCDSARSVNLDRVLVLSHMCWGEVLSDSARGLSSLPRMVGGVSCAPPMQVSAVRTLLVLGYL